MFQLACTVRMLQSCATVGSRCVWRGLLFILGWGLFIIITIHLHHTTENPLTGEFVFVQREKTSDKGHLRGSSSRIIFQHSLQREQLPMAAISEKHFYDENEPIVDRRPVKTEEELISEIEKSAPNLPLAYWSRNIKLIGDKKQIPISSSCLPKFPNIFELEFSNIYWQTLLTNNGTFQLYAAFYDERKYSRIGPALRIVSMINRIEPAVKTYCQMWFEGEHEPLIVEVLEYKYIWYSKWGNYKQGIYQPYVIACKLPQSHWHKGVPGSVSLVEKRCKTATNNLKVIYNKPNKKKDFAVCVKGLDFLHEDLSVRLVEWIELIGLLGADKIFFYELQVHPNISKVLQYYEQLGRVDITPITLPGGQPNVPSFQHMYLSKKTNNKRQNELIPYNDCLYRHMYEYEYLVLLDVDEVIMPVQDATWQELIKRIMPKALEIKNETRASYNVRNVYFLDELMHSHTTVKAIPKLVSKENMFLIMFRFIAHHSSF